MSESLSRRLGGFASTLEYEKLPLHVVDKVKGLILHGLVVSIAGAPLPRVASVMEMTKREEPRPDGAALWVDGARVSRRGAAFANAKMMHATSQSDSYRMLTHPGPCVIPPAVASCEIDGGSGKDLITAVAAGYELETRIASDFIPTTQARGFRSSPVYGVFGAAVATGKVLGLDPGQMANAISLAATFSGGTGEGGRTEGQEATIHESNAAVNGITAALLAKDGVRGADLALEGDAGFYNAFTGNNQGELSYAFEGPLSTDVDSVASGLGERYFLMDVTPKIYPTAGYNQPVIELMARLKATHEIQWDNVDRIDIEMNWLETLYPSPAFPNPRRSERRVGGTHYFAAYTGVHGHYPAIREGVAPGSAAGASEDNSVLELMERVNVIGVKDRGSYSPRMTVATKDGNSYVDEMNGDETKWGLETVSHRLREMFDSLVIPASQLEELVETVSRLDELDSIETMVGLCIRKD